MTAGLDRRGRRILITGGSSGIGLAVARRLGADGARTVLLARGRGALADAATTVANCAGTVRADVSSFEEVEHSIVEAVDMLGGLDVIIAAAGAGAYGPFLELDPALGEQTVATTLLGVMNTARAGLRHLEATRGTFVVVGSVAGRLPVPWLAAYAAAEAGVRGFVRSLAAELQAQHSPVSVALIAPGPVNTPFWTRAPIPDGHLAPAVPGADSAEAVVTEILHAVDGHGHRLERTVGGRMLPAIILDALFPNVIQRPLGIVARLAWRARRRRPVRPEAGLAPGRGRAQIDGAATARPSVLEELRRLTGSGS